MSTTSKTSDVSEEINMDEFDELRDSDAPIQPELNKREVHTMNWVRREAKKAVQQYFECEPFNLGDEEELGEFVTNADRSYALNPITEKEPPPLNSYKYIDETYEHAIPKLIIPEEARGKYFTLMAGFNISHAIVFPFVMMRYGGYFFLIPFLITTILITFPINFAQYTLGQYTNLPPIVLFSRLSPMFIGVGLLVVIVQYMSSSAIRFDHRFVSMTLELAYSLTANREPYDGQSRVQGMMYGYKPGCPTGEIFKDGQCYPQDYGNYRFGKTNREYIQNKVRSHLQSDPFIADYSIAESPPSRIFDPAYQQSHYISAATFLSIFLFFVSLLWVRTYFRRIQHVVFYGSIVTCTLTLVSISASWGSTATILVTVVGADAWKLAELKTWVIAAVHSLVLFGTVDASYLGIGSANKFSNRLFKDLIRAKIGGFLVLMLFSTLFGMAAMVGASIWMMRIEKRPLTVDDYRVLIFSDVQVYEFLYIFFFQNMAHKLLMLIYMLFFCFWEFSSLMLMAEGSVGTVYRIFKSTARLPPFVIRYSVLIFHCSFVLFMHFFMRGYPQLPYLLSPYVVFVQVLTFSLLNFKRFFTIIVTLNNRHRQILYNTRKKMRFYYRYLLTGMLVIMMAFDIYSNGLSVAKPALGFVLLLGLSQMFRYRFVSRADYAWTPTARFRPSFQQDFDEYKRQERALEGRAIDVTDQNEPELDMKKIGRETVKQREKRLQEKRERDWNRRHERNSKIEATESEKERYQKEQEEFMKIIEFNTLNA